VLTIGEVAPCTLQVLIGLAVHPSGQTIASVHRGRLVKVWHYATAQELLMLKVPTIRTRLVFTADGKRLVSAGRAVSAGTNVTSYFSQVPSTVLGD
jgi:hypothetical protein